MNKYGETLGWSVRKPTVAPTGWKLFDGKLYCADCTKLIEEVITPVSPPTGDETR